eukprot:CAMPEP_0113824640 /NCGR_PEP_ID=MMETSP0328-20130328/3345_1 /TAXON_ID=39455 /ORGANISM="Alexandrium minutum" /LENGTH=207 /DNA_ID=CAMNT_0000792583 /DNA_START=106 /DNA_END=726 /DNA_ORIENTATION=+ /assembly_acc=CAM_ASM_000350
MTGPSPEVGGQPAIGPGGLMLPGETRCEPGPDPPHVGAARRLRAEEAVDAEDPEALHESVAGLAAPLQQAESQDSVAVTLVHHHEQQLQLMWLEGCKDGWREARLPVLDVGVDVLYVGDRTSDLGSLHVPHRQDHQVLQALVDAVLGRNPLARPLPDADNEQPARALFAKRLTISWIRAFSSSFSSSVSDLELAAGASGALESPPRP